MLTQHDYDNLQAVDQLPNGCYDEGKRPKFLNGSHEGYLLQMQFLERSTLCPPEKEPEHWDGLYTIHVSTVGRHEMALFEKQLADERRDKLQFLITALLAFLALPGVIDSIAGLIRAWP